MAFERAAGPGSQGAEPGRTGVCLGFRVCYPPAAAPSPAPPLPPWPQAAVEHEARSRHTRCARAAGPSWPRPPRPGRLRGGGPTASIPPAWPPARPASRAPPRQTRGSETCFRSRHQSPVRCTVGPPVLMPRSPAHPDPNRPPTAAVPAACGRTWVAALVRVTGTLSLAGRAATTVRAENMVLQL